MSLIAFGGTVGAVYLWVDHHRKAARLDLERYHNEEAMEHLSRCLALRSHDPETLLLAARAARRLGDLDRADQLLGQYEQLRGVEDEGLILERLLLRARRGDVDGATSFFEARIKERHPDTPLILETLTDTFLHAYRLHDAERALRLWQERDPDNTQALLLEASMYELQDNAAGALAAYRRVVQLDPDLDRGRLRLTGALLSLGLAEEALPHLEYLHRRRPDDVEIRTRLARCYSLLGGPDRQAQATRLLDEVLAVQPNHPAALAERGRLAKQAGQLDEAEALLRRAATLDPDNHPAHYQLYQCLTAMGKTAQAREEFDRLKQREVDVKKMRHLVLVRMQQTPHNPDIYYEAAEIALRAGLVQESANWLHRALKEDPHYVPAHQALAEYYQQTGNSTQAAYHREEVRRAAAQAPARSTSGTAPP
jgi:tetratricopeptide (TPR) repeat protein